MPFTVLEKDHSTRYRAGIPIPEIPPLENGDYLTREEFERRCEAMPYVKKAELIEGRIYKPAAVRKDHGAAHSDVMIWLGYYRVNTLGVKLYDNTTIRMDESNEPQPDASLRIESEKNEDFAKDEGDYLEYPPELVVEVAGTSASYDLHDRLYAYQCNGIQEYLVWQIYDQQLDWFFLVKGTYQPLQTDKDGVIRSQVFPGLHLDVESLLAGDMAEVLTVL